MFLLLCPPPCCLCLHPPLVCPLLLRVLLLGPLLRGTEPQQFYVKFQQYLNGSAMMLSLNTYIQKLDSRSLVSNSTCILQVFCECLDPIRPQIRRNLSKMPPRGVLRGTLGISRQPVRAKTSKSSIFDRFWRARLVPQDLLLPAKVTWRGTFGSPCE